MAKTSNGDAVAEAVERLKSLAEEVEDMDVEFSKPVTVKEVAKLEAKFKLKLPPSYVHFISTYGTFKVLHGGRELIGMEEPGFLRAASPDASDAVDGDDPEVEEAINEALFFQRADDDAVDNFWCFNPRDVTPEGEMGVVGYYHDERFALPKLLGTKHAKHFTDFSAHIVSVIDELIENFAEA
ncbi:SMI1/KNR4 family protein [Myxococcus sp. AM009]|uniref:SMI1/KNR4 family protein n=1 Tax=unclassified Myxococcus TaxID=2648731 RepID=UPI0015958075|nr:MULTISPECIES: SMI1/KNR4 family protein [unclassified Myxococcus]NVI96886.1 SMI1/KNR4 family protein [Myxococcus sp. AM009]NVJ13955.1 SMI1/KNR4 family protein [Myxococcus sp. AM010]